MGRSALSKASVKAGTGLGPRLYKSEAESLERGGYTRFVRRIPIKQYQGQSMPPQHALHVQRTRHALLERRA